MFIQVTFHGKYCIFQSRKNCERGSAVSHFESPFNIGWVENNWVPQSLKQYQRSHGLWKTPLYTAFIAKMEKVKTS